MGRAGDTLGLIVVGGLSALLIGVLLICLLIAALNGSLMATLLMLAAIGGVVCTFTSFRQRTRQAAVRRETPAVLPSSDVNAELASLEAGRIQKLAHLTLKAGASLSPPLRHKLNAAATATRDALRSTAAGGVLTREAHDARQAADDDLPSALSAYQDLRVTGSDLAYGEVLLAEQLSLIERRMRAISDCPGPAAHPQAGSWAALSQRQVRRGRRTSSRKTGRPTANGDQIKSPCEKPVPERGVWTVHLRA